MLIPSLAIAGEASINEADNLSLIDFATRVGLLGPILLRLPIAFAGEENVLSLISTILAVTPTLIDGFEVDNDEIVTQLLDCGLNVAFFNLTSEQQLLKQVLKTLPRSRVGISVRSTPSTLESIQSILQEFRELAGYFMFRSLNCSLCNSS